MRKEGRKQGRKEMDELKSTEGKKKKLRTTKKRRNKEIKKWKIKGKGMVEVKKGDERKRDVERED